MLCSAHSRTARDDSCVMRCGMRATGQAAGGRRTERARERRKRRELRAPCTQTKAAPKMLQRRLVRRPVFFNPDTVALDFRLLTFYDS